MFKKGDYLVYKRDVCEVIDCINMHNKDYYILIPILDKSLKEYVPVNNEGIRKLITKDEVNKLIQSIPDIDIIETNDKLLDNEYKRLINTGKHSDLISIIKTTHQRNKTRLDNNKKISDKDDMYFNMTENYLYSELSVVLGKSYDDTKEYVITEVEKVINNRKKTKNN